MGMDPNSVTDIDTCILDRYDPQRVKVRGTRSWTGVSSLTEGVPVTRGDSSKRHNSGGDGVFSRSDSISIDVSGFDVLKTRVSILLNSCEISFDE